MSLSPENPLAVEDNGWALRRFLDHFGAPRGGPPRDQLRQVAAAFARLPYENLTKIIKEAERGRRPAARRGPDEVVADHLAWGAGGTCFSLTAALLRLVRGLGWRAEPILADRRYGSDTHCALVVWIDDRPHLLDPGYLIVRPIPLDGAGETRVRTGVHELLLRPGGGPDRLELHTVASGGSRYRLTYKASPADSAQFLRAWDASFDWEMMRYPVLARTSGSEQLYLQGNRLQVRTGEGVRRREIAPGELARRIAAEFGLDPGLASRALAVLQRKGASVG